MSWRAVVFGCVGLAVGTFVTRAAFYLAPSVAADIPILVWLIFGAFCVWVGMAVGELSSDA